MFTNDPIKFKNLVDNKLPLLALDPGTKLIGIAISAINKNHSYELLSKFNFPFIKKGDN